MNHSKPKPTNKYRPYLTQVELHLIANLLESYRSQLARSEKEIAVANTALRAIQKTYINASTGVAAAYIQPPKLSIEDKLGLTTSDFPVVSYKPAITKESLSDNEKLELMTPVEREEYWIKFNRDNFGMEPTQLELDNLELLRIRS